MTGPIELLKKRQAELVSQIESGKREGNSYITTGHDILERIGKLEDEKAELDAFIEMVEGQVAARSASVESQAVKG